MRSRVCAAAAAAALSLPLAAATTPGARAWSRSTPPERVTAAAATEQACVADATKTAAPGNVFLGQDITITLHLRLDCAVAQEADVVLAVDRSVSMLGRPLAAAREAAAAFVDLVDLSRHRVGIVSFADLATTDAQLARSRPYLRGALQSLRAAGGTDIAAGLRQAERLLGPGSTRARVVVLLTDGFNNNGDTAVRQAAAFLRGAGATLVTVALEYGAAVDLLAEIATAPDLALVAPTSADLDAIYRRLAGRVSALAAERISIVDEFPAFMTLRPGSVRPPAAVAGRRLRWEFALAPRDGITATFTLAADALGRVPTNVLAEAEYVARGLPGRAAFPVPYVNVGAVPTPTPTLTATTTASAGTGTPSAETPPGRSPARRRFLPALVAQACPSAGRPFDTVLVIDVSTTMLDHTAAGRTKLAAAIDGAREMVGAFTLPGRRMGVVAFHAAAWTAAEVTADRDTLYGALPSLRVGSGSRIDAGLELAGAELARAASERPRPPEAMVVLVSDGRPVGVTGAAVAAASGRLRAVGVAVHAIGVGADADFDLLGRVASPGGLWDAGDGEAFVAVARAIPAIVDCR